MLMVMQLEDWQEVRLKVIFLKLLDYVVNIYQKINQDILWVLVILLILF
jgi:hypothetical protein